MDWAALGSAIGETAATVGKVGGAVVGGVSTVSGALQPHTTTAGTLNANAGIMGIKKPYLIIRHRKGFNPNDDSIAHISGEPANTAVSKLSACKGYTVVKDVILNVQCTDDEAAEIEALLKQGVFI